MNDKNDFITKTEGVWVKPMNEEYLEWLLQQAGVTNDPDGTGYSMLCGILQDKPFYPLVEMDENRWEDGMRLRLDFVEETEKYAPDQYYCLDMLDSLLGGCTVLEVLVVMAEKMNYEMLDSSHEATVGKWMEELIGNLGLDMYTDSEVMNNENAYFEIERVIDRFVFRQYNWRGEGGLFPLRNPRYNQTEIELATQMNNYLMENYDILN